MLYVIDEGWDLRIEKMHFVLVCSLGFSIFPSVLHSALPLGLALGKVDSVVSIFLVPWLHGDVVDFLANMLTVLLRHPALSNTINSNSC